MEIEVKARVLKDVRIPMRDGVALAADVYLPHGPGRYPALLTLSPYGKNTQRQLLPQPVPSPLGDACIEAGWIDDIVARGYAHVIACSRGTGQSEGAFRAMYSEQESWDGYDLVEWIAHQDWCDSQVGMMGISYFGTIQLVVAAARPPHLKAIAPTEATTDQYLACYHGGVLDCFYTELTTGRHSTLSWSGFQGRDIRSFMTERVAPGDLARLRAEARGRADWMQYNLLYSILDVPEKNPIFHDIMLNPYDRTEYWWNPDLSKIDIPVLCGCAWYPDCGPKFVRGPFMIWDGVRGPKKLVMWPGGWLERPFHQYHEMLLDWFDYWLKGVQNGVMDGAPISLYIQGDNHYRDEHEWPLARTQWTPFYLHPHHRLKRDAVRYDGVPPDGYTQAPLSVTQSIGTLRYSTGPLPRRLEVTGPVALTVHVAIDAADSWIKATLIDQAPTGEARELTHGHLQLSHRTLDPDRTRAWQPVHLHTRESYAPLRPGTIYECRIELYPVSYAFKPGHQLVLEICSADAPGKQFSYHPVSADTVQYKIYRDANRPSHLLLPVIP